MTSDRPFVGILFMIGFCFMAPLGDAFAKILGGQVPLLLLVAARFGIQAALVLPFLVHSGMPRLSGWQWRLLFVRTALHIVGIAVFFTALLHLPLAEAIAIAYVMPFIMLLLGWLYLNETVGHRRISACVVGFVGTLMVVQPTFAEVGWPALLPLAGAVVFALFMMTTRQLAREVAPVPLQAVSGVVATLVLLPVVLAAVWLDPPRAVSGNVIGLIALLGVTGTVAHLMMTQSLRFAPAATVAPMQYLEIPFATFIGWVVFRDLPNGLAAAGIVVTMAAGLYIVFRETGAVRQGAA